MVQFPLQITDLDSTLSLSGPVPAAVTAELRGTGKQLIRLRLGEPVLKISLAGVSRGRFERALTAEDLPISNAEGVEVERIMGSRMLEMQLDRKVRRRVPVAPRVQGSPAAGSVTWGEIRTQPAFVTVTGPEAAVTKLFSSLNYGATGDLLMALQGAGAMLSGGDAMDGGNWVFTFLSQWGGRIGGGTDNIQRNTLAERVLGLPSEPRVDKDVPFRELTRGPR